MSRPNYGSLTPVSDPVNLYVGFDPRETIAHYVFIHSVQRRSSSPVHVIPVMLSQLEDVYTRERDQKQSTDFSFARFLVPWMNNYEGWSLWVDGDMLCRDDIVELWNKRDNRYAVQVIKHHHVPKENTKFLGAEQTKYEKKNWSSVILFNNKMCRALTPKYVNEATGLELHQFKWLEDDSMIGDLPHEWNLLVDYDEYDEDAKLVHFTKGAPCFNEFAKVPYAEEWYKELRNLQRADQLDYTNVYAVNDGG